MALVIGCLVLLAAGCVPQSWLVYTEREAPAPSIYPGQSTNWAFEITNESRVPSNAYRVAVMVEMEAPRGVTMSITKDGEAYASGTKFSLDAGESSRFVVTVRANRDAACGDALLVLTVDLTPGPRLRSSKVFQYQRGVINN